MKNRAEIFTFIMLMLAVVAGSVTAHANGPSAIDGCDLQDYEAMSINNDLENNVTFGITNDRVKSVRLCDKVFEADFVLTKEDKDNIDPEYLKAFYHGIIHNPEYGIGVVEFNSQADCFNLQGVFIGFELVQCQAYAPDWD